MSYFVKIIHVFILVSLYLSGCCSPIVSTEPKPSPSPSPFPNPQPDFSDDLPAVSVGVPEDIFDEIKRYVGQGNQITIRDAAEVQLPEVLLKIPAGLSCSFSFGESEGRVVFDKPYPKAQVKKFGFTVTPSLYQIDLYRDGSGKASTSLGKYAIRWMSSEEEMRQMAAMEEEQKPKKVKLIMWSDPSCVPCMQAEKALENHKIFELVKTSTKPPELPSNVQTVPTFLWFDSKGQLWYYVGWRGLEDLEKVYESHK